MNIVVDLEHTISNAWHRINNKTNLKFKYAFQEEFKNDRPNENVILFINQLVSQDNFVIILSAKQEKYRLMVERWLMLHDVEYNKLILKPDELFKMSALEFKEKAIKGFSQPIDFALNDVGKECAMFAENNIPCLRIEQR